jgi:hypothetical protein
MSQYNISPLGTGFGYILGLRSGFAGLEFGYTGVNAKGDMKHDGADNTISHSQKSYTLTLNLFLNPQLFLKFGYGVHKVSHTLENKVDANKEASINELYGFLNESKGGMTYGLGFDFFKTRKGFNMYTAIDRHHFHKEGTTTTVQFGFKYLFGIGIGSIISR